MPLKFYAPVYEQSDIHTCMNKLTAVAGRRVYRNKRWIARSKNALFTAYHSLGWDNIGCVQENKHVLREHVVQ